MYEYIDAEESLISCLMSRLSCMEDIYGMLSPDMFDGELTSRMFYEYQKAYDDKREITITELHQAVAAAGFRDFEITDAIKACVGRRAMAFQAKGFATTILNHYKKRQVDAILERIDIKDATVDEQIEGIMEELDGLRGGKVSEGKTIAEISAQYSGEYFTDQDKRMVLLNDDFDNMTGGFQGGDLVVLGARPGIGKSALATQWAESFAKQGLKVGYYNLEMQERAVLERFLAAKSGIEITRIRLAKAFLRDEEERYRKAVEELSKQENIVLFTGAKKVSDIRKDMRQYKFDVIVLDYMQLLIPESRYQGNRAAEVGEISRSCKDLAMSFDCVVLALTQLNRLSEGRQNREPQMAEIRESGNIEQDASIIFLMWQPDETDRSKKTLKVEKSRNGICGRKDLKFDGAKMRFTMDTETPFD